MSDEKQLREAREKLDAALGRLEQAVAARPRQTGPQTGEGGSAQSADVARLTAELAALQSRSQSLVGRNEVVSQRLDGTIDRLKAILEG